MEYRKFGQTIVLRLNRSENITEQLLNVAEKEDIHLAHVTAIGGVGHLKLGVYDPDKQAYNEYEYNGNYEILNLTGNITEMNGQKYAHLHVLCSGEGAQAFGGHLLDSTISLTCEMFITVLDGTVTRKRDETLGINLFSFD